VYFVVGVFVVYVRRFMRENQFQQRHEHVKADPARPYPRSRRIPQALSVVTRVAILWTGVDIQRIRDRGAARTTNQSTVAALGQA
jgi:hypothetical protein